MNWLQRFRSRKERSKVEGKSARMKSVSLMLVEHTHQTVLDLAGDITSSKNGLNDRADKMVDSIQGVTKLMEKEGDRLSLGRR